MSKHTPGKWKLRTEHHGATDLNDIVIYTDEREILRTRGDDRNIWDFFLIIDAPELLEAAKEAHDELSGLLAPWAERLAEKLGRAIEKAEDGS